MSEQPEGVKPLAIIALALGAMGVLGGVVALGSLVLQSQFKQLQPQPGKDEVMKEFQRRLEDLQARHRPILLVSAPLAMLASSLLVAGGASALRLRGRVLARGALAISFLTDLFTAALGMVIQVQSSQITRWYFEQNPHLAKLPAGFSGGMQAVGLAGAAMGAVWALAKLGFYLWGIYYLGRPAVRAVFEPPAPVKP